MNKHRSWIGQYFPVGWVQPWGWMHYHYYEYGEQVPVCGDANASRRNGLEELFDVFPSPEFLELFGDWKLSVCKKCYRKFMRMQK